MIYKVLYHESEQDNPRREYTEAIYVESESSINVREQVENNTEYNIEYIQALDEKHLEYEKNSPNFKLTEF